MCFSPSLLVGKAFSFPESMIQMIFPKIYSADGFTCIVKASNPAWRPAGSSGKRPRCSEKDEAENGDREESRSVRMGWFHSHKKALK